MKNIIKPYRAENMLFRKKESSCHKESNKKDTESIPGFIDITVCDKISNKPICNAEVKIIEVITEGLYDEKGKGTIIYNYTTDENGKTPIIVLPITKKLGKYNIDYNNTQIYYHMVILAPEYNSVYAVNLQWQIFPDVTTIFKINLSHANADNPNFDFIIIPPTKKIHEMPSLKKTAPC